MGKGSTMGVLRLRIKYSAQGLFLFIALFCVSTFALLEHSSISIPLISRIKLPLLYTAGICLLTQIKSILNNVFKKRYFFVFVTLGLLCVALLLTMYVNLNTRIGFSPLRNTVRLILYLVELFILMMLMAETGRGNFVLNFVFYYLLVLTILNDFLLFSRFLTFRNGKFETYIVGTKFSVVYFHMNLLTFWVMRRRSKSKNMKFPRWLIIVLAVFSIVISARIDCMTGIVGAVVLVVFLSMMESPKHRKMLRFVSPAVLLVFLIGSVVFSFVAEQILSIPVVSYLVEDVLGRDATLTGRTNIYLQYVDKVQGHWLAGFGYGNGNAAAVYLFGYENVQNAILQWVLQIGIPATVILLFLMMQIFHRVSVARFESITKAMPLIAAIYMYIILATVETTFNMSFIMWFAILFMLANEKLPMQER